MALRLVTLDQLKAGVELPVDEADYDDQLVEFGETVEAFVEDHCDYNFDQVVQVRTWDAPASPYLWLPGATIINSVTVDGVSTTAFRKLPDALTGVQPHYNRLLRLSAASGGTPINWAARGQYSLIAVTATWGYSVTVPRQVQEAVVILVSRLFRRWRAHFGNQSGTSMGASGAYSSEYAPKATMDKDVDALLYTVCRKFPTRNISAWK